MKGCSRVPGVLSILELAARCAYLQHSPSSPWPGRRVVGPGDNLSLQPRLRAAPLGRMLRWPYSHLPSFSHPTLPLRIILGIIVAVWGAESSSCWISGHMHVWIVLPQGLGLDCVFTTPTIKDLWLTWKDLENIKNWFSSALAPSPSAFMTCKCEHQNLAFWD